MSARQNVFNYMTSHPDAPLQEVLSNFTDVKETTIRRYYFEFQKADGKQAAPEKKKTKAKTQKPVSKKNKPEPIKKSLKLQISEFLEENPGASLKELCQAFPKAQKNTVSNYRRQWQKTAQPATKEIPESKRKEIIDYLNRHPHLNINDLKKVFPEAVNKLITIFRSWKATQNHEQENEKVEKEQETPPTSAAPPKIKKSQKWLDKHKETIARQKKIIEQQKTKIEALKSQLPSMKRPGFVDSLKNYLIDKFIKK